MSYMWQAQYVKGKKYFNTEHQDPLDAIKEVEDNGEGTVVKFNMEKNLPGLLPEYRAYSCSMWSFNGTWSRHYIFDGVGGEMSKEKPY